MLFQSSFLIHVEIALEDAFLEGVGHLWLLGHLSLWWWLHDGNTLGTLVDSRLGDATGNGRAFSSGSEVLSKVVALSCFDPFVS